MTSNRRDFLKTAVGTSTFLSFAPASPWFLTQAADAAAFAGPDNQNVLVVLQLSGGNDGLNTVVPVADDAYGRARTTLRLTSRDVIRIDDLLGFHPRLDGLSRLYQEGTMSVVQGVGYPNSDRSHDTAMRDWHTAMPGDDGCQTGWVGRAIDWARESGGSTPPGMFVGPIPKPLGVNAQQSVVPQIRSPQQLKQWAEGDIADSEATTAGDAKDGSANPLLDSVRLATREAYVSRRKLREVLAAAGNEGGYPDTPLGGQMRMVAQLIRASLGTRIFFCELGGGGIGGFDNHAGQRDNHAALLGQLSEAVTAFANDLNADGSLDRVLLMTFSEFGRTLTENGRRGTGHGAAAPVFLVGGGVRGGLIGEHPSLQDLDEDAPKPHTDFREVYATVLEKWLGFDSTAILGKRFETRDVLA